MEGYIKLGPTDRQELSLDQGKKDAFFLMYKIES